MPFWPGGLEDVGSSIFEELEDGFVAGGKGIRTIPPGFARGLRLPGEEREDATLAGLEELDRTQKHPMVGQGEVASAEYLEPCTLSSGISLAIIFASRIRWSISHRKLGDR